MKNLLGLASYTSSVLNPQETLGFRLEIGSLESRVQGSDWVLVVGGKGMVLLANNANTHDQIPS